MSVINKNSIYNLNKEDLFLWAKENEISEFYAKKIWQNLYRNRVDNFSEMLDIKEQFIDCLEKNFYFPKLDKTVISKSDDGTAKFLFELEDKSLIETVLMKHKFGYSVCVTTQIGCNIACSFCASGLKSKERNLEAGEILSQVLYIQKHLDKKNEKLSHVVVMGIGEPFDNYKNLIKFLNIINDDNGLAIASKNITVSTSGLVPKIIEFAKEKQKANLAISLHASNNKLRSSLMKINKIFPLEKLFSAINEYIAITKKRITFEYIMIKDYNDSIKEAKELVDLLKPLGKNAYVNLIPYNPVFEVEFERSKDESIDKFCSYLIQNGIRAIKRKEHGGNIDAACGQLRSRHMKSNIKQIKINI